MEEKLESIHNASLQILAEVGIRLHHPAVLSRLADQGLRVVGDRAFFQPEEIMTWVAKAPPRFTLHARNPENNVVVGNGASICGPGYGAPTIVTTEGRRRAANLADLLAFLQLVHVADGLQLNGGVIVQPATLPAETGNAIMFFSALISTDKALLGIPGRAVQVRQIMELSALVWGSTKAVAAAPRLLTLVNTLSPLQIDTLALETIEVCAAWGQPLIISPGPMAGATGPVTLAGNLALANAEALAGIAVCQVLSPGLPVVYGLQATTADMRTGAVNIGSPGFALQALYGARLARRYGLPCRGGGASTDAHQVSVQSGFESMLALSVSRQAGLDIILHTAGILAGYGAMSYEQFVTDLEMLSMLGYLERDLMADAETLALETISAVGSGGQYFTQRHTLDHCRQTPWRSFVNPPAPMEGQDFNRLWIDAAGRRQEAMRTTYHRPEMDPALEAELEDYLRSQGCASELLKLVAQRDASLLRPEEDPKVY